MYRVIAKFADAQDENRIYEVGEEYPRKGLKVSKDRLAELASVNNGARKAVIAEENEPEPEAEEILQPKGKKGK